MVGYMDDLNRDLQAAGEMVEGRGLAGPDRMEERPRRRRRGADRH